MDVLPTRFAFGKNWAKYLELLNEDRLSRAEESLKEMLEGHPLDGRTFLDIGSGSGLFSLAARRLGARITSFDYDRQSVECTLRLRDRFFPNDVLWRVEQGSVLDAHFMRSLGTFDIVYSWGVLHHTGAMWRAIELAAGAVAPKGVLYIAIYNDQGIISKVWAVIKRLYNTLPAFLRFLIVIPGFMVIKMPAIFRDLLIGDPMKSWKRHTHIRGMSPWRDLIDWVGGYPFEVAKPDEIIEFLIKKSFVLRKIKTCGGKMGCNEYVFEFAG
jgi:SAM-dependent methyltransferase